MRHSDRGYMYHWNCMRIKRVYKVALVFFFQAEDGIRDLVRSRGLGDVYKRQALTGGMCSRYQDSESMTC